MEAGEHRPDAEPYGAFVSEEVKCEESKEDLSATLPRGVSET